MNQIKRRLPPELNFELISSLPLNTRWANVRICSLFDFFVLEKQFDWLKKVVSSKNGLLVAKNRLLHTVRFRQGDALHSVARVMAKHFGELENVGLGNWSVADGNWPPVTHYTIDQFDAASDGNG
ncbi:hypothetical protein GPALN_004106 [Globodera pallida]|nr:hypothetical protein GPALN_004106 [Globodera pallida]